MTMPNSLRTRPGRARPVRHPWRPLRRRDADAADPGARAGLRGRPSATRPSTAELRGLVQGLCRPPVAALLRRAADRASRRGQDLLQARRAQPHRRAQDQQRAGPDDARPAHGQEADHRRDRRRPARRRDRHRRRPLRPGMHRLHGRARHRAAAAQRVPHEAPGCGGPAGDLGLAHAQGRAERGPARLGQQPARHLLRHRHGRRPAPLSGHGARLPVGDRQRGARRRSWRRRAACRTCWWRRSAAAPTPWACSTPSSTTARCGSSRSRPRATASPPASMRRR